MILFFLHVNEAFEKIMGIKRDSIVGSRASQVALKFGQEKFDFVSSYKSILLSKSQVEYESYFASIDTWYRIYIFSTEPNCFVVKFLNITIEKQMMIKFENLMGIYTEKELTFYNIVENLPFSLSIIALDGTILFANEKGCKLFEISSIGKKSNSLSFWVNNKDRKSFIRAVEKNKVVKGYEYEFQKQSGKRFWAVISGMKISYKGEYCILSTQQDISDKKKYGYCF